MKVAYFTLLNPLKSGISDWAEELLPHLKKYFDIDLFVPILPEEVTNESIKSRFKIFSIEDWQQHSSEYDFSIYQVGNNSLHEKFLNIFLKTGGVKILELHDIALHHYLAETTVARKKNNEYLAVLEYCHGKNAVNEAKKFLAGQRPSLWESESLKYSVIKHFVDRADGVIVHSDFAKQIVKGIAPQKHVCSIPLPSKIYPESLDSAYKNSRKLLNISDDEIVIASFGFATPSKRILQIIHQLANLKKFTKKKFSYYILGENRIPELIPTINNLELEDTVHVMGRVSAEEFELYCKASDLCFNLRFPTQGESSASLMQLLGFGKKVVVTDIGSFHDFPDFCVYKIRHGVHEDADILKAMLTFFKNFKGFDKAYAERTVDYVKKNYNLDFIAKMYSESLTNSNGETSYMDKLLDSVMDYPGFEEKIMQKLIG